MIIACVTPAATRSLEMPVHAVSTEFSMLVWIVWREVTAEVNALALASALHPVREEAELQPPFPNARVPIVPASTIPGTNLKVLRCVIESSPSEVRGALWTPRHWIDEQAPPRMQSYSGRGA